MHPDLTTEPSIRGASSRTRSWRRADAIRELLRGRLTLTSHATPDEVRPLASGEDVLGADVLRALAGRGGAAAGLSGARFARHA